MKKKEILFTITAIFILMIITAYYVAFIKPKNINFEQPNIEIPKEDNDENIEGEPPIIEEDTSIETSFINKYKWLGYKEVEIPSEMPELERIEPNVKEITETKDDEEYDDKICNIAFYSNLETTCVNVEVINNKSYFIFNDNKIEIPIDNIKKVYISRYEFQSVDEFRIYFLTKDGDIYEAYQDEGDRRRIFKIFINENISNIEQLNKEISERLEDSIKNIKKVNNKIKYKELFVLEYFDAWRIYDYAGTTFSGDTYLLYKEIKFDKELYTSSQYISYGFLDVIWYVNLDGNVIIYPFNDTNIKFKFGIGNLIFSDKNIAYEITDNDETKVKELGELKLLYLNKKKDKIAILLEDGKVLEY